MNSADEGGRGTADGHALVFHRSIHLDLFNTAMSMVLCVGAIMAIVGDGDHPFFSFLPYDLAAWGWLVFFGWAGSLALSSVLDRSPRLLVSDEGIQTRIPLSGKDLFLQWSEIEDVHHPGFGSIHIDLRNVSDVKARIGFMGRLWMRINRCTGSAPVVLNGILLRTPTSEIISAIRDRLDRRLLSEVDRRHADGLKSSIPPES